MTDKQWEQVESSLNCLGQAKLKIDGYNITLTAGIIKKRLAYTVYINGAIKVAHALNECEERRRFYNKHIQHMCSAAELRKASKKAQKILKSCNLTFEWYEPFWYSFSRMKSHFIKNNESIEFIETN